MMKNCLGKRLQAIAKESGKGQSALAKALGVTRQDVNYYFNGKRKPNIETLVKICDFYGVSADYLLGLTNSKETEQTELKAVSDYTRLNYSACMRLTKMTTEKGSILSFLINDGVIDNYIQEYCE